MKSGRVIVLVVGSLFALVGFGLVVAGANVSADLELGGRVDYLVPIAIGLGVGGVVLLAIGAAMILGGVARPQRDVGTTSIGAPGTVVTAAPQRSPESYPLRIEGHLDADLSRWQWLFKWILAIPHFVVLFFLWVAFAVLTVAAFFAIVFTGRYPRPIFDFNVGVLRWTWRVSYYATSALGTDRYPPFTLDATDYPASLEVDYPERLSRGLALIKSWLLAIPHLLIVFVLSATWTFGGDGGAAQFVLSGGLLGILVVIAVIILTITGRYPIGLHNLIMGINRWIYRVIAYVALMTDDYPPFHLDQGGPEPATPPPVIDDSTPLPQPVPVDH